jgi:hypothetical protein
MLSCSFAIRPGRRRPAARAEGAEPAYDENARERLLAKLNAMAENIKRRRELHGEAPPGEDDSPIAEPALDAPKAVDS